MPLNLNKTKGEVILSINNKFNVPKLILFDVKYFYKNKDKLLLKIKKIFKKKTIIVRSSSLDEDTSRKSNAGKYKSIGNIKSYESNDVKNAVIEVIKSYNSNLKNKIIVQEMLTNVKISGVCTTVDIHNYSPVININYSLEKETDTVTSGKKNSCTLSIADESLILKKHKFYKLIQAIKKLKKIFNYNYLDIEFAIDKKNKLYILQVRKIIIQKNKKNISKSFYLNNLKKLKKKIIKLQEKNYDLLGNTNCFGIMPDWNPAEIIGTKPRPLALSLYKELITDHIWSKNRNIYGFKNLESHHLMTVFFGTPFIDVRVDFNSWIPNELNKKISEKLVNFYLDKFKKNKKYHDKIEFKILFTCYSLSTEKRINKELKNKFSLNEINLIKKNLIKINNIAYEKSNKDLEKIYLFNNRLEQISSSKIHFINKIYFLIEDCKKYGSVAFAGLARCAFIAIEILNSFVQEKIISEKEKNQFLNSIENIATKVNIDFYKLNKKDFINKYGHLRPSTYDITSMNYKEGYNLYFNKKNKFKKIKSSFKFSKNQKLKIMHFIKKNNFIFDIKGLIKFIKNSIYYREYSKFIFTKSIDAVFENLTKFGKKYGLTKNDLSYLEIGNILELHYNLDATNIIEDLKKIIIRNKNNYIKNQSIHLPEIITNWKDLYIYEKNSENGNFITQKKINGETFELKNLKDINKIKNKILLIENADPGYDFIFSQEIKGLITKYGGQNSHMSIRSAELSLPAAIGVNDENYNRIKNKKNITIDCLNKKIY